MSSALLLAAALLVEHASAGPTAATNLRVEYHTSPINVEETLPRFSWVVAHTERGQAQTAYWLNVRNAVGTVVWNTGRIISPVTQNVVYAGPPLLSDADYSWNVTWWDTANAVAPASDSVRFSTALLPPTNAAFGSAAWVAGATNQTQLLRTEFALTAAPVRARLYIMGLGAWLGAINGVPVDDHVLFPFTQFEKHVTYDVVDVTRLLRAGCNAFSVLLSHGWYSHPSIAVGPRALAAFITVQYTVGGPSTTFSSSVTGGPTALQFNASTSPLLADDVYDGESVDGRLWQQGWDACGFTPSLPWMPAVSAKGPPGGPASYTVRALPITADEDFIPIAVTSAPGGAFLFDFGQTGSYQATLRLPAGTPAGLTITLAWGELEGADGSVSNPVNSSAKMVATYVTAGRAGEAYRTLAVSFGARYAQVTGFPGVPDEQSITAHFVHTRVPASGALVTSSPLINAIQHATVYSSLSNLADIPTDCPQVRREAL